MIFFHNSSVCWFFARKKRNWSSRPKFNIIWSEVRNTKWLRTLGWYYSFRKQKAALRVLLFPKATVQLGTVPFPSWKILPPPPLLPLSAFRSTSVWTSKNAQIVCWCCEITKKNILLQKKKYTITKKNILMSHLRGFWCKKYKFLKHALEKCQYY